MNEEAMTEDDAAIREKYATVPNVEFLASVDRESYPSLLVIKPESEGRWRTLEPFPFTIDRAGLRLTACVPGDFITDFASVPYVARWLIRARDEHIGIPSVIHDFLYQIHASRALSDAVYYVAMAENGTRRFKKYVVFGSVRLGGWAAYNKYSAT